MSDGSSPVVDVPPTLVSSVVPAAVPFATHKPSWPAVSEPLNSALPLKTVKIGWPDPRRRRPDDASQFLRAAGRPVRYPESGLAACVNAAEERITAKDGEIGRSDSGRSRSSDGRQLHRAANSAVRGPQSNVAARIDPCEQNLAADHR
jgi:hypothetical protein